MSEVSKTKVKARNGDEYIIKYDGHHYRAYDKDGNKIGEPFVMIVNLLESLDVDVKVYDLATAAKSEDQADTADEQPAAEDEKAETSDSEPNCKG